MASIDDPPLSEEDQGRFRFAAAAVVRLLIRARDRAEPGFLTQKAYEEWSLKDRTRETLSVTELLEAALAKINDTNGRYVYFCASGGTSCYPDWLDEGDVGTLKQLLGEFIDAVYFLPLAIQRSRNGQPIDWQSLVRWETLPELRKALDRLPDPRRGDGIDDAGVLRWGSKKEHLGPRLAALGRYLWNRAQVRVEDVGPAVWGKENVSDRAVRSAIHRLNVFLGKVEATWEFHIKNAHISKG
jgi:hypothetical protein